MHTCNPCGTPSWHSKILRRKKSTIIHLGQWTLCTGSAAQTVMATCNFMYYRLAQEAIDEEANHLRQLEQTKQQVVRDKQGRLQAEVDAVVVPEEERKEVCSCIVYSQYIMYL